jgi:hypothetical protein
MVWTGHARHDTVRGVWESLPSSPANRTIAETWENFTMRARPWLLGPGGLLAVGLLIVAGTAAAQEFRVDTELFFGHEKTPQVEALTIFADGRVYDFLLTPPEIALFDPARGQFTLLDEGRRVKATITTQDLMGFALDLETHAVEGKHALLAFAARPKFETTSEEVSENGQELVRIKLAGKPLEYTVLGQKPQRAEAVKAYRHFADWYARLNATRPNNLPPGARLALNEELAKRELLPREITRTIAAANPLTRKDEVKSQHLVNWTLSKEDRKRIERAHDALAQFKPVSFDEYRKNQAAAAGNQQAQR